MIRLFKHQLEDTKHPWQIDSSGMHQVLSGDLPVAQWVRVLILVLHISKLRWIIAFLSRILYYFDQFVHHVSHAKWFWTKSVLVPRHTKSGWLRKTIGKMVQKPYFFEPCRCLHVVNVVLEIINLRMRATAQRGIYESLRSFFFCILIFAFNHGLKFCRMEHFVIIWTTFASDIGLNMGSMVTME